MSAEETRQTPTPATQYTTTAAPKVVVDEMPFDRAKLAGMTPEERSAIYLNQIRKMLGFFVVLALLGIIAGVIIGIVDINTVRSAQQSTGLFPG